MSRNPAVPSRIHLVQLAGGQGLRAGGGPGIIPKQFRETGRGPLFCVSLQSFLSGQQEHSYRVESVTIVVPDPWRAAATDAMKALLSGHQDIPWALAPAGSSRTGSTWNALSLLAAGSDGLPIPKDVDLLAIHDAARPFASTALMGRLVAAALVSGSAVPGIPVHDTVVQRGGGGPAAVVSYLQRETLLAVQTPQIFRWDHVLAAHQWAAGQGAKFTDDGGLLAARGHPPVMVEGDPANWKITTEADWNRAQEIFKK